MPTHDIPPGTYKAQLKSDGSVDLATAQPADYATFERLMLSRVSDAMSPRDPWRQYAAELNGTPYDQVTERQRRQAKARGCGLAYAVVRPPEGI